jgi:hypothetical protein
MFAEKEREPEEGEPQKSPTHIVAESLSQISRSSTFLPNMGVIPVVPSLHQPWKHDCVLSLRPQSKQKERKLLGSRNNCKHKFTLNKPHLKQTKLRIKKTNLCYARPKKR